MGYRNLLSKRWWACWYLTFTGIYSIISRYKSQEGHILLPAYEVYVNPSRKGAPMKSFSESWPDKGIQICQKALCKSSRLWNGLGKKRKPIPHKAFLPIICQLSKVTNPRVVTLTVQHQGKLLISYSFFTEYSKKRRVFNSENHHPVLPCTLMITMQITTVTWHKLLVPL